MNAIEHVAKECFLCSLCVKQCAFLQNHGTPGTVFDKYLQGHVPDRSLPFQCNLCGLCSSVCPKELEISNAFLQMRKEIVADDDKKLQPGHSVLCGYERRGRSKLFSLHHIPESCDTVFFPGCALSGTRSKIVLKCFAHLQRNIPQLGLILDCCSKPSHDLGRDKVFREQFLSLLSSLKRQGIKRVITACSSCHVTFEEYSELEIVTVYELLAQQEISLPESYLGDVVIHDTCVTRSHTRLHDAVRLLVEKSGAHIREMTHSREKAICCGEGAAAGFVVPHITAEWREIRKGEAMGDMVITYCAGCSETLARDVENIHLLDLLFDMKRVKKGRTRGTRSPFTYIKRLLLKWRVKQERL